VIGSLFPDSFQISLTQFERRKRIIKKRINLPLDSYEADFQWDLLGYPLTYKATVKKNLSIFLIFKTKI